MTVLLKYAIISPNNINYYLGWEGNEGTTMDQHASTIANAIKGSLDVIEQDTERDNFMTSKEAKEYGIIDDILHKKGN